MSSTVLSPTFFLRCRDKIANFCTPSHTEVSEATDNDDQFTSNRSREIRRDKESLEGEKISERKIFHQKVESLHKKKERKKGPKR